MFRRVRNRAAVVKGDFPVSELDDVMRNPPGPNAPTSEVDALQIRVGWLEREVERLENSARLKSLGLRGALRNVVTNLDVALSDLREGHRYTPLQLVTAALIQLRAEIERLGATP